MKRAFIILLIATCAAPLFAQADALALAAQREQEENVKRLTATIQDVQEAQTRQQERVGALAGEIDKLRSEVAKANNNAATHEALKSLETQIKKVDSQRVADNEKIEKALADLRKLIVERPAAPPPPKSFSSPGPTPNPGPLSSGPRSLGSGTEEGFEYQIQSGDRLDLIVKEYQKQGIKVTMKQVMDANPTVKWERLKIGQKIFIPKPK